MAIGSRGLTRYCGPMLNRVLLLQCLIVERNMYIFEDLLSVDILHRKLLQCAEKENQILV